MTLRELLNIVGDGTRVVLYNARDYNQERLHSFLAGSYISDKFKNCRIQDLEAGLHCIVVYIVVEG